MNKPNPVLGMRHLALYVTELEACVAFYTQLIGMKIDWQPDNDDVYLSSGSDNLALHRAPKDFLPTLHQRLDHFGFVLAETTDVDIWHSWLATKNITILVAPRDHRDGSRSFYCQDPDGNNIQFIYLPT